MPTERPPERLCIHVGEDGKRCNSWRRKGESTCLFHDPDGIPDHLRCTAPISGGIDNQEHRGERCQRMRAVGLPVCHMHGASKAARRVGQLRVAEEKLMASASRLVGEPVENPLTELANLAGRARALMERLEARVEALLDAESEDGTGGAEFSSGIRYEARSGEQIRGEVQLYERSMDRLGKILVDIGRLDIDSRLAKIQERQIEVIVAALDAGLTAAGIRDVQQRTLAKTTAARQLRAVN